MWKWEWVRECGGWGGGGGWWGGGIVGCGEWKEWRFGGGRQ